MPVKVRVLIVDDYGAWRRYVAMALQAQPDMRIVGEATDGLQAVEVAEQLQPDLILLDMELLELNGIEAARRIRKLSANSKILFVSTERNQEIVLGALRAGAHGYLDKADAGSQLFLAIRTVLQDREYVSSSVGFQYAARKVEYKVRAR